MDTYDLWWWYHLMVDLPTAGDDPGCDPLLGLAAENIPPGRAMPRMAIRWLTGAGCITVRQVRHCNWIYKIYFKKMSCYHIHIWSPFIDFVVAQEISTMTPTVVLQSQICFVVSAGLSGTPSQAKIINSSSTWMEVHGGEVLDVKPLE